MHQRHGTLPSNSRLNRELLLEDDEEIHYVIKKHPFGLFAIYIGVIGVLLLAVIVIGLALSGGDFNLNSFSEELQLGVIAVLGLIGIILVIVTHIYIENKFIITNKHIVQVLQMALFSRKISQLSLLNVEDVTAEKIGFFATIFNFGTLKVETAGEQKNFIYSYCPDPNYYADAILDARQELIKQQTDKVSNINNPVIPGSPTR